MKIRSGFVSNSSSSSFVLVGPSKKLLEKIGNEGWSYEEANNVLDKNGILEFVKMSDDSSEKLVERAFKAKDDCDIKVYLTRMIYDGEDLYRELENNPDCAVEYIGNSLDGVPYNHNTEVPIRKIDYWSENLDMFQLTDAQRHIIRELYLHFLMENSKGEEEDW